MTDINWTFITSPLDPQELGRHISGPVATPDARVRFSLVEMRDGRVVGLAKVGDSDFARFGTFASVEAAKANAVLFLHEAV